MQPRLQSKADPSQWHMRASQHTCSITVARKSKVPEDVEERAGQFRMVFSESQQPCMELSLPRSESRAVHLNTIGLEALRAPGRIAGTRHITTLTGTRHDDLAALIQPITASHKKSRL